MKMISTWFRSQRGLAIGTIVGALTVGKATPYLIHALPNVGVDAVILTASGGAMLASLLVASLIRTGLIPLRRVRSRGDLSALLFACATGVSRQVDISVTCGSCMRSGRGFRHFLQRVSLRRARPKPRRESYRSIAFGTIAVGGAGMRLGRTDRRQIRARAARHDCARGERNLFADGRIVLWCADVGDRADCPCMGILRSCRQRAVQRTRNGVGTVACSWNRADRSDLARIPAHDADDSGNSTDRRENWLAVVICGSCGRPCVWNCCDPDSRQV